MSLHFFSIPEKRLAASILETDYSFRVSNLLDWNGIALSAADFGTIHYVAFRNSTNTVLELMEIDPTSITSGLIVINKRGLAFNGGLVTEITANKKLWVKGNTIVSFGTNPPQLYEWLKEYIDGIAIAGSPDASTTAKGIVELSTQAQLRARTATGETGAKLAVTPDLMPNVLISDYVADTGTADAYVIAPTPAIVAYVAGQQFTFKATSANTTTSTLNVNGLGVKTIKKLGSSTNLAANDILAGQIVQVEYDGTQFQMLNSVGNAPATAAAVAAITVPTQQIYTSNNTWTKPAGLKYIDVEVQASGAGGGIISSNSASGGGAGGYGRKRILAASLGATETVTVGAAVTYDTNGNNSSFGAHVVANGATKGVTNTNSTPGGVGGTCTGGDINIPGHDGGFSATALSGKPGDGGNSQLGMGGAPVGNSNNPSGTGYGSGGAATVNSGGGGAAGIIIVKEYYI